MIFFGYVFLGLTAGICSGILGIGGAVIIIPALVYIFGFGQHMAEGTTLALMVPPIGLLAAWEYYTKGFVNLKVAVIICITFFIGGYIGAKIGTSLSPKVLKKVFGFTLFLISLKMLIQK